MENKKMMTYSLSPEDQEPYMEGEYIKPIHEADISETDGGETFELSGIFSGRIPKIPPSNKPTPPVRAIVCEVTGGGKADEIMSKARVWTQGQIVAFCRDNSKNVELMRASKSAAKGIFFKLGENLLARVNKFGRRGMSVETMSIPDILWGPGGARLLVF